MVYRVRRLWLRDFRNYARADVAFGDGVTVLVGANGQGKSNLLEAIYFVTTGRSHRTVREAEAIAFGAAGARVRALVLRRGREEEQEVVLTRGGSEATVRMRIGGVETPRSQVLGRVPVVLAAPWDLELVRGAAVLRRRLLDVALAQLSPAYYFAAHRYYRVVAQRNAALRARGGTGLEPWEAQMLALGVRVVVRRRQYVAALDSHAGEWFARLGGPGILRVRYRPSWEGETEDEIMAAGRGALARRRADELKRGVTLSGPQRDDVELLLDGVPLRVAGSLGQWRLATLALRLAERAVMAADLGAAPVLLLDDVLAELDDVRQRRVLQLSDAGQVVVTATTPSATTLPEGARVLVVKAGEVSEETWSPQSATS
jgi:DNA replication and repair protein RecF